MAEPFHSVSAFLCEKLLKEEDGITSAIRIVDIFQIPHDAPTQPEIVFGAYFSFKMAPVPDEEFRIVVRIVGPTGTREKISSDEVPAARIDPYHGDRSIPAGITVSFAIGLKVKSFGTGFVEFEVNGKTEARLPFTVIRLLPPAEQE